MGLVYQNLAPGKTVARSIKEAVAFKPLTLHHVPMQTRRETVLALPRCGARLLEAAVVTTVLLFTACQAKPPTAPESPAVTVTAVVPTTSPSPSCVPVALSFHPVVGAPYHVRVTERKQIYQSEIVFQQSSKRWEAIESEFSLQGSYAKDMVGDLSGARLLWTINAEGIPELAPQEIGSSKVLKSLSAFAFWPVAIPAEGAVCVGTRWSRRWPYQLEERRYDYAVESVRDGIVSLRVRGGSTIRDRHWEVEGTVEVSTADGFSGSGQLHIRGPGAPEVNDYDRTIVLQRVSTP